MAKEKKPLSRIAEGIRKRGTEGALTRQARSAGKSISEFCAGHHHGKAGRRCALAKTFKRYRPRKSRRSGGRR